MSEPARRELCETDREIISAMRWLLAALYETQELGRPDAVTLDTAREYVNILTSKCNAKGFTHVDGAPV